MINAYIPRAAVALLLLSAPGFAQGRPELQAPAPLKFHPREHMSSQYLEAVVDLCDAARERPGSVESLCQTLNQTLNQEELLRACRGALGGVALGGGWREKIELVNQQVEQGRYVAGVPVEFRSLSQGGWELKWRTWEDTTHMWSGPYEVRRLTADPKPHVVVELSAIAENGGRLRFGYRVLSQANSERSVTALRLEIVGLTSERMELLNTNRQTFFGKRVVSGHAYRISAPEPGVIRRVFTIQLLDPETLFGQPIEPGQAWKIPPLLAVPWASLPGVTQCWIDTDGPDGPQGLSGEDDPEDIIKMVYFPNWEDTPVGRNKIPRWDYHGKTIGPVPTPDEGTPRGEWVDQLVAWHEKGRKWGWYDKGGEELWETRAADLKADPSDRRIRDLLAKAEDDHEAGRLLEETYALWRYNLEYLLKMPQ